MGLVVGYEVGTGYGAGSVNEAEAGYGASTGYRIGSKGVASGF